MTKFTSFRSYAQNQEDVALWRALGHIEGGHYVEVGAYHPIIKSTSYAFYERNWSGILIEPQSEYCKMSKLIRPRDDVIKSAVGSSVASRTPLYRISGGTRSTIQAALAHQYGAFEIEEVPCTTLNDILKHKAWAYKDFHFLVLDVEGAETAALEGLDLSVFRPWVLIVEAIDPWTKADTSAVWENLILSQEYVFSHFDGVSQFFVAHEHREILSRLYPACSTDKYIVDFPRLPSEIDEFANVDRHALARTITSLLQNVTSSENIFQCHCTTEEVFTRVLEFIETGNPTMTDKIEDFAFLLRVACSRARINYAMRQSYGSVRTIDPSSLSDGLADVDD